MSGSPEPSLQGLSVALHLSRPGFTLDVDFQLPLQGIAVLFGSSGSGKTTVLRCLAGLERAKGVVRVGTEVWQDCAAGRFMPTWQRDLGYVFQEASLLDHLSVRQNLVYGLKRASKSGGAQALDSAVQRLGISHLMDRTTAALSGGERQRIAIARALATQPRLLLLDEPLAALDQARKQDILPWLERLRDQLDIPVVYVTHSPDELSRLADYLVVLDQGQVRACGPVAQVLARPEIAIQAGEDAFVLATGQVTEINAPFHLAAVRTAAGLLWVRDLGWALGQHLRLRISARDVSLTLTESHDSSIQNRLPAQITAIHADAHPSQALVTLTCAGSTILSRITQRAVTQLGLHAGMSVWCQIKSVAVMR